ncbi:ATP-dependent protease [Lujinxingia litoralis]|uniref:ATP-dependent protease n=1 Tax=Lujinxingia litoralis TaxID=2211119 RepID=A0A328C6K5_9DELT|nr:YifB family Mg chelatase-like AAA ATPase [Lujinxingia litoralis]RAL21001.1 ATP-dependent protease [Lujinxingia litoralis]
MITRVHSATLLGVDARQVDIEIDFAVGLPAFHLVGLPDNAVRESRLRVQAAIENLTLEFPVDRRVTVNLAPANIRKDGTAFDLPIALAILRAQGVVPPRDDAPRLKDYLVAGELALDGRVRPIRGALAMAILARDMGLKGVMVPQENAAEAAVVRSVDVLGIEHLSELVALMQARAPKQPEAPGPHLLADPAPTVELDFSQVCGQLPARRALEVAAAGAHNVLMIGPPGSGKSMLARRLATILPQMSFEEALETTKIYSVTGRLPSHTPWIAERPFRAPHHTISEVGLVGGGSGVPRPGELSMAHNGVLFLDELPEFRRNSLETLRQPLENGQVTLTRSLVSLTFPADVMLVAAMNPCRCGHFGNPARRCSCSLDEIKRYRSRLSGPLLDRIDIHIGVPAVPYDELRRAKPSEASAAIRQRVQTARDRQRERLHLSGRHANSQMGPDQLRRYCALDEGCHRMLGQVVERLGLSARSCDRMLKVARTIADLAGSPNIEMPHLAEAIHYRSLDRPLDAQLAS